jgi:hypothetical protein
MLALRLMNEPRAIEVDGRPFTRELLSPMVPDVRAA